MANPVMKPESFSTLENPWSELMTLQWTINKSIILVALTVLSALATWQYAALFLPFLIPLIIVWALVALVIFFKDTTAPYVAPVYAVIEWIIIGTLSAFFELQYPGIVMQAVGLTFVVSGLMLFMYKTEIIKVTEQFRSIIVTMTWAIMVLYLISIVWSLSGWYEVAFLHSNGPLGIGVGVLITGIAAFNLLLDFDLMEKAVAAKAPKYYEWYAGFSLLITLVWLYIEILRLLSKIRSR